MKTLCLIGSTILITACSTLTQREMRAANAAIEATWKSATADDWASASTSAGSVPQHVRSGVEARPIRRVNGTDMDLRPLLAGWECNAARELIGATRATDPSKFKAAMHATLAHCTACHAAAGKPQTEIFQPPARGL